MKKIVVTLVTLLSVTSSFAETFEIRVNDLDKDLDLYDGTTEFYQPKANNPIMNMNCVKTR